MKNACSCSSTSEACRPAQPLGLACLETALGHDPQRLALAVAHLPLWKWVFATAALWVADEGLRVLDLEREALTGGIDQWRRLVHPDDVEVVWAAEEAARSGSDFHAEYRVLRPDGRLCWVESRGHTESDTDGVPCSMVGTLADITERKQAEVLLRQTYEELERRVQQRTAELALANTQLANEVTERRAAEAQLRELLGQLVDAEEEERRRLARELHDSLGQHLTALTLGLQAVQRDAAAPLRERLSQLRDVTRRLDEEVDRLSYQLRPVVLDNLGLCEALRELATAWSRDTGIAVDVHVRGLRGQRFAPAVETTVYRVVQEALTNTAKHADAAHVGLIMEQHDGELRVIVEDDGRSFDAPTRPAPGQQLGLRGMAERARLAGGRLEAETATRRGTTVYLSIPLSPHEA